MKQFHGIYPALVTPFDRTGGINETVVKEIVNWHLKEGVDGFYICGGTGEGLLLSPDERRQMLEATVRAADGRGKVIAHVATLDTATTIDLAQHAEAGGAAAVSVLPPIYYNVDSLAAMEHYRLIASATRLPLFVYHIPALTGKQMSVDEMRQLLEIPNVSGLKFSDYDHFNMHRIRLLREDLIVYSGNDEVFLSALNLGANGGIGLTYNFMPQVYVEIYQAFLADDIARARELQQKSCAMIDAGFQVYGMGVAKAALQHLGFDVGEPRRPLRALTPDERTLITERMDALGLTAG
ncbi:MAG: dihydrodipicolinate synthase family protein [Fuerstiella sp.]|nr:dihydrodipicolinate synthase family protein [Fuerstiella sp.]